MCKAFFILTYRNQKRNKDKIRNAKQRDKHTSENEKSTQSNTDSKPQRTNIRQRGEPSPLPKVADNEVIENKTESSVTAKGIYLYFMLRIKQNNVSVFLRL